MKTLNQPDPITVLVNSLVPLKPFTATCGEHTVVAGVGCAAKVEIAKPDLFNKHVLLAQRDLPHWQCPHCRTFNLTSPQYVPLTIPLPSFKEFAATKYLALKLKLLALYADDPESQARIEALYPAVDID